MSKTYRLKNVIYFPSFNIIGGVETYCYEMALKYGKDYDITVCYRNGDPQQMDKIAKVCRVLRVDMDDKIICDVFIFGWGWDILKNVTANRYIQTYHADYINRKLNPCQQECITDRLGVSENTTKGIKEHYDWAKDIRTMYNPYTPKKPRRVLNLISATRLTAEKGFERMKILCKALDDAGIPFLWLVFTDQPRVSPHKSMVIIDCRVEGILDYIANADYLVQLSDTEGYSYSIVEALSVGTPVIATDFLVAREQGIEDGKTGWILPMDMSRIPIKEILKGIPKFKWSPPESHYEEVLAKGKSSYEDDLKKIVTLRALIPFLDIKENKMRMQYETWQATMARGVELDNKRIAEIIDDEQPGTV